MGVGGVQRIEVTERERPVFGGTEFGAVGPYERLHGTIFGELDPTHPLNAGIVNLDRAARNAHGNVEYQSDFRILKPLDLDRGNGCLVYDVPNRGNQPIMPRLNGAPDGGHPQHAGNGFLMRRGFTVVWSGWQGDVPPGADRLTARFPIIPGITGMVREEFIAENTGLLGDNNIQELSEERFVGTLVYPVADPHGATLTVRQREADPRVTPAGLAWRLVDDRHVEITRPTVPGFDRGAIYEFIYRARDPIVMGIGFAAIRDIVSFLRHATKDNPLAPQGRPRIRRALGFGISQSGRVLRDLVHLGFNQDLAGRQVFDGILPVVAGIAPHLRQLAVCAGRPLFAPARGPLLRRRPVPVQLSDADRSDQWPHRRHPAARPRCRRVPEGAASRYRKRLLAGAQFADRDRYERRRHRHAGRGAGLCGERRAACAVSALDQAGHAVARQSARLRRVHAGAAGRAVRVGGARHRAAGQPVPVARRRHAGAARGGARGHSPGCRG